jgi:hypothetical protein
MTLVASTAAGATAAPTSLFAVKVVSKSTLHYMLAEALYDKIMAYKTLSKAWVEQISEGGTDSSNDSGRMQHPHICNLVTTAFYSGGPVQPRCQLLFDYLRGGTLTQWLVKRWKMNGGGRRGR